MEIYFVRHGKPDYRNDILTELGHKQAQAAAERLRNCGIECVYSSTRGRALQTAEHTAELLGLEVLPCEFMREINWGPLEGEQIPENGHPWNLAERFASEGKSLLDTDWRTQEPFCRSKVVKSIERVSNGLDEWLSELGYTREGSYYRVTGEDRYKTVAMFGHGGSFAATLSHLFNITFPQCCGSIHIGFTGITVVRFENKPGDLIYPKLILCNESKHIEGIDAENIYGI